MARLSLRPFVRYSLDVSRRPVDASRHASTLSPTSATCGAVLRTSPDWRAGYSRAQSPGNRDRAAGACRPSLLEQATCRVLRSSTTPIQRAPPKKTPPQWGRGGASTGGSPRRARPGHRTERRNQYDTRQRKIVRAQLPWIVNAEIQFGCCASTTVSAFDEASISTKTWPLPLRALAD